MLAREQRAVDIAEHGFDVAEGGVHGGLSGLRGGAECGRKWCPWYTKAQARPLKAKTTTKVPGHFVVAGLAGWPGPGRKPSQHSTLFGKIAIFAGYCDGFTAL